MVVKGKKGNENDERSNVHDQQQRTENISAEPDEQVLSGNPKYGSPRSIIIL